MAHEHARIASRPSLDAIPRPCRFVLVGGMAYLVCAFGYKTLLGYLPPELAWPCAWLVATTMTWLGNRTVTFRNGQPPSCREWGRWVASQSVGGLAGMATGVPLTLLFGSPWLATAIATAIAAVTNYLLGGRALLGIAGRAAGP